MPIEIERKFRVNERLLPDLPPGDDILQGYLCVDPVVRVRLRTTAGGERTAQLTIKGRGLMSRSEFEYQIPPGEAQDLLALCRRKLRKKRHRLGRWEVDHFPDLGLWLAEIELSREDEPFERPAWLGEEVTGDPAYANSRLASEVPAG